MTQQYPITPPPELLQQWLAEAKRLHPGESTGFIAGEVARLAYQAGADQELEACCEWLVNEGWFKYEHEAVEQLRAARRPKPLTTKQRAQRNLANMIKNGHLSPDLAELFTAAVEMAPDE